MQTKKNDFKPFFQVQLEFLTTNQQFVPFIKNFSWKLNLNNKKREKRLEHSFKPLICLFKFQSDAIAKALYSRLFSWLVERINSIICKEFDKKNSIAILDIFGFENFSSNGFEQLCINYANETLQFYFNKHIFKLEQEEYAKEKINWKNIDYVDNKPCIDLISKKPNGIIHVLDDESSFPKVGHVEFFAIEAPFRDLL